ncbi:MAG: hypothetical protein JWO25_695, partial [Alphaproteobacteria bacterium]|nr:hypothetical protein [Alphaproteobacteria bacterium]
MTRILPRRSSPNAMAGMLLNSVDLEQLLLILIGDERDQLEMFGIAQLSDRVDFKLAEHAALLDPAVPDLRSNRVFRDIRVIEADHQAAETQPLLQRLEPVSYPLCPST